jgi:cell division protein FtsW
MMGVMTNAARHEPDAVAALRAGRDDRVNRLLRLPVPDHYSPSRLEVARDRLRTRPKAQAAPKPKPKSKAKSKPKAKAKAKPGRTPVKDDPRRTAQAADRPVRRSGHHGGRQREQGRRARSLEGQRHG